MGQLEPGARLVVESLPAKAQGMVRIGGEEAAHARARRVGPGDRVVLVDGSGREAIARVVRLSRGGLEAEVESVRDGPEDSAAPIFLFVAAIRSERLSWIAEKAAELGAARLTLVSSERTQRFRASEGLTARLERVVREAAKQAECARWPEVRGPVALAQALSDASAAQRFLLDLSGEPFPAALDAAPTALLVGPEGGWTEAEISAALDAGWVSASLAAGKLRAETAAVAALLLARTAMARGAGIPD